MSDMSNMNTPTNGRKPEDHSKLSGKEGRAGKYPRPNPDSDQNPSAEDISDLTPDDKEVVLAALGIMGAKLVECCANTMDMSPTEVVASSLVLASQTLYNFKTSVVSEVLWGILCCSSAYAI